MGGVDTQYDLEPLREDEKGLTPKEIRTRRCKEDIKAALDRWGCRIEISVLVSSRGNRPHLEVLPEEDFQATPEPTS